MKTVGRSIREGKPGEGKVGLVLGKFMPPHSGHLYLINFAREYCERVHVVVGSLESEPIAGILRYRWMNELCGDLQVHHLTDENPQLPEEHPDFWQIWKSSLERILPEKPDYVFASEAYGDPLAKILDARFVPVNGMRGLIEVSGTAVRDDPLTHWNLLPPCVRSHYAKRICIFGPESTGKTTLAKNLAFHYETVWVPEYARQLLEAKGGDVEPGDFDWIARGQMASENALARNANKILICDSDVATTRIWSEALFDRCPDWIVEEGRQRRYDLHFLADIDVPFVDDPIRYLPNERRTFMTRCIQALEEAGRSYVQLSGSWAQRFEAAHREIDRRFFSRETPGKTFQAASEKPRDSHLEKGEAGP